MGRFKSIVAACVLTSSAATANAFTFQTINDPLGTSTYVTGISNGQIVGDYIDGSGGVHGFLYNGSTFTTIDYPGAAGQTQLTGISNGTIVGDIISGAFNPTYSQSTTSLLAFTYNNGSFTALPTPADAGAAPFATGISNGVITGVYSVAPTVNNPVYQTSFEYAAGAYSKIVVPGYSNSSSNNFFATGIAGTSVVGYANTAGNGPIALIYSGGPPSTFAVPVTNDNTQSAATLATGLSGSLLVGYYTVTTDTTSAPFVEYGPVEGFLSDGSSYTSLIDPNAVAPAGGSEPTTAAMAIDGQTVVGYYSTVSGYEGFEVTVPEPAAALFLLAAVPMALMRLRHHTATT